MLSYTELKPGTIIVLNGEPCRVVSYNFVRMQAQKPTVQTKLKSLISGKTFEKGFKQSDKIQEADISRKKVKFLYSKPARGQSEDEFWFCEENNPSARFNLSLSVIGDVYDLMKPNSLVEAIIFAQGDSSEDEEGQIIGIELPAKINLKVVEAPPNIKGNTAQGGSKPVKVETGAMINTPLFIETGDTISVNTQTREYAERVEKG